MNKTFNQLSSVVVAGAAALCAAFFLSSVEQEQPVRGAPASALQPQAFNRPGVRMPRHMQAEIFPLKGEPPAAHQPAAARSIAPEVLQELAAAAGVDSTRFSEEEKRKFAELLAAGRYEEAAKQAGVELSALSAQERGQLAQILADRNGSAQETGKAGTGEEAGTGDGAAPSSALTASDPYQALRDAAGAATLYREEQPPAALNDEAPVLTAQDPYQRLREATGRNSLYDSGQHGTQAGSITR